MDTTSAMIHSDGLTAQNNQNNLLNLSKDTYI